MLFSSKKNEDMEALNNVQKHFKDIFKRENPLVQLLTQFDEHDCMRRDDDEVQTFTVSLSVAYDTLPIEVNWKTTEAINALSVHSLRLFLKQLISCSNKITVCVDEQGGLLSYVEASKSALLSSGASLEDIFFITGSNYMNNLVPPYHPECMGSHLCADLYSKSSCDMLKPVNQRYGVSIYSIEKCEAVLCVVDDEIVDDIPINCFLAYNNSIRAPNSHFKLHLNDINKLNRSCSLTIALCLDIKAPKALCICHKVQKVPPNT